MGADKKYRDFRNYMVNELGVTRQDIEAWTKQSVATEIEKVLKGIKIEDTIDCEIRKQVREAVSGSNGGWGSTPSKLQRAIADELIKQLVVRVEHKE